MKPEDSPQILRNALRVAEDQMRKGQLAPLLLLEGPKGSAVLRLSFDSGSEQQRLRDKARLMAVALAARSCACVFQAPLQVRGRPPEPAVVVAVAEAAASWIEVFSRCGSTERPSLLPLATPLAGPRLPGTLAALLDTLLPQAPTPKEIAHAWTRLEAMGVTIGNGGRALH